MKLKQLREEQYMLHANVTHFGAFGIKFLDLINEALGHNYGASRSFYIIKVVKINLCTREIK